MVSFSLASWLEAWLVRPRRLSCRDWSPWPTRVLCSCWSRSRLYRPYRPQRWRHGAGWRLFAFTMPIRTSSKTCSRNRCVVCAPYDFDSTANEFHNEFVNCTRSRFLRRVARDASTMGGHSLQCAGGLMSCCALPWLSGVMIACRMRNVDVSEKARPVGLA